MEFNINSFRSNGLVLGGARPSQFQVWLNPPTSSPQLDRMRFLISAASLPAFYTEAVSVPYFGRQTKFAGDRTFDNWAVTVMNDEDFPARAIFEKWSNQINSLISNRLDPSLYGTGYKQDGTVIQYGKDGRTLRSYQFVGMWPMQISAIQLDWSDGNRVETFDVTFALDYYIPLDQSSAVDTYSPLLPDDGNATSGVSSGSTGSFNGGNSINT